MMRTTSGTETSGTSWDCTVEELELPAGREAQNATQFSDGLTPTVMLLAGEEAPGQSKSPVLQLPTVQERP